MTEPLATSWYSARVRLVVLVGESGAAHYADSIFLFRSEGYDSAFRRALELGRGEEESYYNGDGARVAWRLKEILTLDELGTVLRDGAEVHYFSVPLGPDDQMNADSQLNPEGSVPSNTGVGPSDDGS